MNQYTFLEFSRILKDNGFHLDRINGSHYIYVKDSRHISISRNLKSVIANRLIKENNLSV